MVKPFKPNWQDVRIEAKRGTSLLRAVCGEIRNDILLPIIGSVGPA